MDVDHFSQEVAGYLTIFLYTITLVIWQRIVGEHWATSGLLVGYFWNSGLLMDAGTRRGVEWLYALPVAVLDRQMSRPMQGLMLNLPLRHPTPGPERDKL